MRVGRRVQLSERTIQRKLERYDAHGFAGLVRQKRSDAGRRAVALTKAWDTAVPFDPVTRERIAHELRQYVRGLVKAGESPTLNRMMAAHHLAELTRAAGFDPDPETLKACCVIPDHLIQRERVYKRVHTFKTDQKRYQDKNRPRTNRTRAGLRPNDLWVFDVHVVDIAILRDDGTRAYLRGISTLDLATGRIFITFHLFEKGKGVTNRDVINHFIEVVAAWGAPRAVYLDNGSEYNWADFIGDALRLIDQDGRRVIGDLAPWAERRSNVVRAGAYNAPAKPIEGIFRVLERSHWHMIPGWEGGERWAPKTARHGREPEPFPGTFDQLVTLLQLGIETYHNVPQTSSENRGKSPYQLLRTHIDAGWGKVAVEPDALRIAFATEETRRVVQGSITFGGNRTRWTSRALQAYQGDTVTILVPKFERPENVTRLPCRDEDGRLLDILERDRRYGFLEAAGAREARDRERPHRAELRRLDRSAPDQVPLRERAKLARAFPPAPEAPFVATLKPSEDIQRIAQSYSETAEDRDARVQAALEKRSEEAVRRKRRHTELTRMFVPGNLIGEA